MSDQILEKIQVVVCHRTAPQLPARRGGTAARRKLRDPSSRVVVTAPPERVYLFNNEF